MVGSRVLQRRRDLARYYVNPNAQPVSGDHEVHREGCYYLGLIKNPVYLGTYYTCGAAVARARSLGYAKADGCFRCSPECHTS